MQETVIGKGSTGLVFRKGKYAYKNASSTEAEIYRLLKGKPGIAPGFLQHDKIVTPFYPAVVSVDTVRPDKRSSFVSIVMANIERINQAVSFLSAIGYEYSDPLKFGLRNGRMDLLDFSNGTQTFRMMSSAITFLSFQGSTKPLVWKVLEVRFRLFPTCFAIRYQEPRMIFCSIFLVIISMVSTID